MWSWTSFRATAPGQEFRSQLPGARLYRACCAKCVCVCVCRVSTAPCFFFFFFLRRVVRSIRPTRALTVQNTTCRLYARVTIAYEETVNWVIECMSSLTTTDGKKMRRIALHREMSYLYRVLCDENDTTLPLRCCAVRCAEKITNRSSEKKNLFSNLIC